MGWGCWVGKISALIIRAGLEGKKNISVDEKPSVLFRESRQLHKWMMGSSGLQGMDGKDTMRKSGFEMVDGRNE